MDHVAGGIIGLFLIGVVYLSALVTYHALLSEFFSGKQKAGIIAIAWLLPLLGPIFCLLALVDDVAHRSRPGVLLDYLFLSWVFTRASTNGGEESAVGEAGVSHRVDDDGA